MTQLKKSINRYAAAALISLIISTSMRIFLFQDVQAGKISMLTWVTMLAAFYFPINFIFKQKIFKKWQGLQWHLKSISILLIPLAGSLFIQLTDFSIPVPYFILPKQHIWIETTSTSNHSSSGQAVVINGMLNGEEWLNLKTMDAEGNYELINQVIVLDEHPARFQLHVRVDRQLHLNLIAGPDGGRIRFFDGQNNREIDLYSEEATEVPVVVPAYTPEALRLMTHLLFMVSWGFLVFFLPFMIGITVINDLAGTHKSSIPAKEGADSKQPFGIQGLTFVTAAQLLVMILLEWLFQITKPSFMCVYSFGKKTSILLASFSLLAVVLMAVIYLIYYLLGLIWKNKAAVIKMLTIVPALIQSVTILLLVDNFTYTLFGLGVVSAKSIPQRFSLLFIWLMMLVLSLQVVQKNILSLNTWFEKRGWVAKALLIIITAIFLLTNFTGSNTIRGLYKSYTSEEVDATRLPDIILITSDGVNARNMSLFGYERDTTPFMIGISQRSLLAVNAFSNSAKSTGSIIAALTGRYPSETRVLNPSEILQEADAYDSLVKILRDNGYFTMQIGVPHYIDAYEQYLLDGFDEVNGRPQPDTALSRLFPQNSMYLLGLVQRRINDRIGHLTFIKEMPNVFEMVDDSEDDYSDSERIDAIIRAIRASEEPLFAHVHLMGTHGKQGRLFPSEQLFSKGRDPQLQEEYAWDTDFYDDSIHDFDRYVRTVYQELALENKLDDSILIIGSDHGQGWTTADRIPLLIRFPHDAHAGVIEVNAQNIDIAPTILDYLNIEIPEWMEGDSLIAEESREIQRPIFSFFSYGSAIDQLTCHPPFYQFRVISVVDCQNWYSLDLEKMDFSSGVVRDYWQPCSEERLISREQALELMISHLKEKGFDTSSIELSGGS